MRLQRYNQQFFFQKLLSLRPQENGMECFANNERTITCNTWFKSSVTKQVKYIKMAAAFVTLTIDYQEDRRLSSDSLWFDACVTRKTKFWKHWLIYFLNRKGDYVNVVLGVAVVAIKSLARITKKCLSFNLLC